MPSAEKTLRVKIAHMLSVLSALITALMLVSALMAQIRLVRQNNEALALREELDGLREENKRLTIEYESAFSAERIDEYAREVLGMQRAFQTQTVITDTPVEDKIVISK